VLGVLRDVQRETGTAIIIVTHDLGVIAELADTVTVLHQGRVIAEGTVADVQANPEVMAVYLGDAALEEVVA